MIDQMFYNLYFLGIAFVTCLVLGVALKLRKLDDRIIDSGRAVIYALVKSQIIVEPGYKDVLSVPEKYEFKSCAISGVSENEQ